MKRYLAITISLFILSFQGIIVMAETENTPLSAEGVAEKPYKKMAPKFFAFTPESNADYRVAILINRIKTDNVMEKEEKNNLYINEKIRGTVTIYKQPKRKNRPELVKKIDIQEFHVGTGGYFATQQPTVMLFSGFRVEGINEQYIDRNYYSIYVELESTEDLEDIGILVHKGHKPPIM